MSNPRLLLAMTTCADQAAAERLARALVEHRLAACVSAGSPITSVYPWQDRVETETEVPLTIKTAPHRLAELKRFIEEHHECDVPELLIVPVVDGAQAYFQWAEDWTGND